LLRGEKIRIRNPLATRPWQHVLEPLGGYLLLAQKLYEEGPDFAEAWNFGPEDSDARPVEWIVKEICSRWGEEAGYEIDRGDQPHEARYLKLDCSKAKSRLGWYPRWNLEQALEKVLEWVRAYRQGGDLRETCWKQIREYEGSG
jgi:CDP-glucose 4,6-dehydratase